MTEQDDTAPLETSTPGYTMLNADVSVDIEPGRSEFELLVRGTNLLNEDARRATSFFKNVAPLPGRAITVGLRFAF
ncbi:MAG: hypothetical protein V3T38_06570 [Gammaproteobacteria bacterium]